MKTTLILVLALAASTASAVELIDCPDWGTTADNLTRGFYVPSYPGSTLDQVDLQFATTVAGEYTIRLTVREDTYDGAVIGVVDVTETLTLLNPLHGPVTFLFPSRPVTPLSTVTFALEMIDAPTDGLLFYGVSTDAGSCPVVQTNGTSAPLDVVRRDGVIVTIHGADVTPTETETWSTIKTRYR